MANRPGAWKTRASMIRQTLARHPKVQAMLDEVIKEVQTEATHDGLGVAVVGLVAFEKSLRERKDVSVEDVLDGLLAFAADIKKERLPDAQEQPSAPVK